MADLEEKILKQNVPGRYSNWQDENDDVGEGSDDDQGPSEDAATTSLEQNILEEQRNLVAENVPEPIRQQIAARRLGEAKTGVKGVLADYREAKTLEYFATQQEKQQRQQILTRIAEGAKIEVPQDDDEDDDFMREYRRKRLAELQQSSTLPVFGEVKEVSAFEFVDEVDKADSRVCVCVHLYEINQPACVRMNKQLEGIASRHPHVKFLRMRAGDLKQDIDHVALPMLMIYRAGAVQHVLARVQDELGETFGPDDVEWLLESNDVFEQPRPQGEEETLVPAGNVAVAAQRSQRLAAAEGEDDEDL